MSKLTPLEQARPFTHIVGTGGIGTGMFFNLLENHTLGRNESRLGELLPSKDYCKLHIILHYIAVLIGNTETTTGEKFRVVPIGRVGNDERGRTLLNEMKWAGMETDYVEVDPALSTLFSVCFQYPDSTGGNITTFNSASGHVSASDIPRFFSLCGLMQEGPGKGMILAVPEVPVQTRIELLRQGQTRGSLRFASVLSGEVEEFRSGGGFQLTDVLAVNIDEARAIARLPGEQASAEAVVEKCIQALTAENPDMRVSITDGPNGSYGYANGRLERIPPLRTEAAGTGGAGDAFLSGIITGLHCGLPFLKGCADGHYAETPVESAMELATLLASLSVTSPDTIHQSADAMLLKQYADANGVRFSSSLEQMFSKVNV